MLVDSACTTPSNRLFHMGLGWKGNGRKGNGKKRNGRMGNQNEVGKKETENWETCLL